MARKQDTVDPSQIIEEPRKRKPTTIFTEYRAQNPLPKRGGPSTQIVAESDGKDGRDTESRRTSPAPYVEEVDDEDAVSRNIPPANPDRLLEHIDDDADNNPGPVNPTKRPAKKRSRIESDSEDDSIEVLDQPQQKSTPSSSKPPAKKGKKGPTATEPVDETPEQELARLSKFWTSPIYAFFEPVPAITYREKDRKNRRCHEFKCAAPNCLARGRNGPIVRRFLDTGDARSTGNLTAHAQKCWGEELVAEAMKFKDITGTREALGKVKMSEGKLTAVFKRTAKAEVSFSTRQLTYTENRVECVRWSAECMRPFSIVEDRPFVKMMKSGRPGIKLPSAKVVGRDSHVVFKRVKKRIVKMLKEYDGKLSFATDCWTSPNHRSFIAITVHLEHEGEPLCMLLDIVEVAKSHTGENLAAAFAAILAEYKISDKVLAVACDNASANDVMIAALHKCIASWEGKTVGANRVRCLLHVLNLAVRLILRQFDSRTTKDLETATSEAQKALSSLADGLEVEMDVDSDGENSSVVIDDGDGLEASFDDEHDDESDEEATAALDEVETTLRDEVLKVAEEAKPLRTAITKVRKIALSIKNSSTLVRPKWMAIVESIANSPEGKAQGLTPRVIPYDVATRWNSTYTMLDTAYKYREAVNTLTADRSLKLRDFELDDDEWEILKQLADNLKMFKTATLAFSSDNPSLPAVIPTMDTLDERLTNAILSPDTSAAVKAALSLGKNLLNKYYSMTDYSDLYRISMALHPRYKLKYFKKAKWGADWIEEATRIVREEFERAYAHYVPPASSKHPKSAVARKHSDNDALEEFLKNIDDSDGSGSDSDEFVSELDAYLAAPREKGLNDPMEWWRKNKSSYPRLYIMARDYLMIPATSVAVERVFSRGRLILSHLRNRMSGETTRALMCLGAWSRLGLMHDSDLEFAASQPDDGKTFVDIDLT